MSLEERIAEFLKQPGTFITQEERDFIEDMRNAAARGVGYGWMQQVIEWEWQSKGAGALGPERSKIQLDNLRGSYDYAVNTLADALGMMSQKPPTYTLEFFAREAADAIRAALDGQRRTKESIERLEATVADLEKKLRP